MCKVKSEIPCLTLVVEWFTAGCEFQCYSYEGRGDCLIGKEIQRRRVENTNYAGTGISCHQIWETQEIYIHREIFFKIKNICQLYAFENISISKWLMEKYPKDFIFLTSWYLGLVLYCGAATVR